MASMWRDGKTKGWVVQFTAPDGRRPKIVLGKLTQRQAEAARGHIEGLLACRIAGASPTKGTADWLAGVSPVLRERIERAGLVEPQERRECLTLGQWLDRYLDSRKGVMAKRTEENCEVARKSIEACFGRDRRLRDFTEGDADEYRLFLDRQELAEGTIRRRCGRAKQFFGAAVKRGLLERNPFEG